MFAIRHNRRMTADRQPTTEAVEFGEHLTALHETAGRPSFGVMSRTLLMNGVNVSDQQLGNYHAGRTDPRKVRGQVLWALCRFYGARSADLGPVAAAEITAMMDLTSSDQQFHWSGCSSRTAA